MTKKGHKIAQSRACVIKNIIEYFWTKNVGITIMKGQADYVKNMHLFLSHKQYILPLCGIDYYFATFC